MDYFAGLDISMDETHVCVLDRRGVVVRESKTSRSTAQAIAGELAKAPSCHRIVFETGRMAPILFHGLNQLGLPVVCVESRQAYQALKSLATHKTDRNDARGTGALGSHRLLQARSCEVAASSCAPLVDHCAQEVGWPAGDLRKPDPRPGGRVRDPAASRARRSLHRSGSQGKRGDRRSLCSHAGIDYGANRSDDCGRCDRRRHETYDKSLGGLSSADDHPGRRPTDCARLCWPRSTILRASADPETSVAYLGLVPRRYQSGEVGLRRQHLEVRGPAGADPAAPKPRIMLTRYKGQLKLKDWAFAIAKRSTMRKAKVALARRLGIIMHAMLRDETEFVLA